jgi:hypothetical protein
MKTKTILIILGVVVLYWLLTKKKKPYYPTPTGKPVQPEQSSTPFPFQVPTL